MPEHLIDSQHTLDGDSEGTARKKNTAAGQVSEAGLPPISELQPNSVHPTTSLETPPVSSQDVQRLLRALATLTERQEKLTEVLEQAVSPQPDEEQVTASIIALQDVEQQKAAERNAQFAWLYNTLMRDRNRISRISWHWFITAFQADSSLPSRRHLNSLHDRVKTLPRPDCYLGGLSPVIDKWGGYLSRSTEVIARDKWETAIAKSLSSRSLLLDTWPMWYDAQGFPYPDEENQNLEAVDSYPALLV